MSLFESALQHRGDELGNLLEFYRPYLTRLADVHIESDLRPRFSASDAAQQTMIAAAIAFEKFQGTDERDFRKWIISILKNQIVDGRRFHRNAERRDVRRQEILDGKPHPSFDADAAEQANTHDSIDQLLTAIENLPDDLRLIVRSRYLQGKSFEDIAEAHGLSRESARRRWKEALLLLGRELRKQ